VIAQALAPMRDLVLVVGHWTRSAKTHCFGCFAEAEDGSVAWGWLWDPVVAAVEGVED